MAFADLSDAQRDFLATFLSIKTDASDTDEKAWTNLHKTLEPQVAAALNTKHPDASKIRAAWSFALEKAQAGEHSTAMKAGERLAGILGDNTNADASTDVPKDVVAFQQSRIIWIGAKRDMKSGLDSFQTAVMKQAADDEDAADIEAATKTLLADFDAFDNTLENQLDQITQTVEGPDRTRLKKAAKVTIQTYIKALEGPFFSAIDSNPFVSVNVAARGRQCLSAISATLG